jgi:rhodanese-related sulfurtransferase
VTADPRRAAVLVFGDPPDLAGLVDVRTGPVTAVDRSRAARVQLDARFALGVITADVWEHALAAERRLLVHNLVAHLVPGGRVWIDAGDAPRPDATRDALACGLEPVEAMPAHQFLRTSRTTVHDLVTQARSRLARTTPVALAADLAVDRGSGRVLLIDTRTPTDRSRFGTVPGSIHIPRTTLEWRADPASGYSHPQIRSFEQRLVVMCNEGYSSSLAAVTLQQLGFENATDVIGGFAGWRDAGLPVALPAVSRDAEAGRR